MKTKQSIALDKMSLTYIAIKNFSKASKYCPNTTLDFDAWVYSTQLEDVIYLAKQFPETSIVLDHLGTPAGLFGPIGANTGMTQTARENIFFRWKDDLAKTASLSECLYRKCSGLFMPILGHRFHKEGRLASKQEVFDLAHPMITHALACFGTYRVMFASNFPIRIR